MGNSHKKKTIKRQKSSLLNIFKSNSTQKVLNSPETIKYPINNRIRLELLVCGFIRDIGTALLEISNDVSILSMIPSSIYQLCSRYCKNPENDYLYLWCSSSLLKNYISYINIRDLDDNPCKFKLKQVNHNNGNKIKLYDKKFSSTILLHDISKSLIPKQYDKIWTKHEDKICGIVRIGGKYILPEEFSAKCNIILFNLNGDKIIDGYIESLPNILSPIGSSSSIYNPTKHIIYNVGGINSLKQMEKTVASLNINYWNHTNNNNDNIVGNDQLFEWRNHLIQLNIARYQTALSWIGETNCNNECMLVSGGCSNWVTPTKSCELIRFNDNGDIKEIVNVSPMNYARAFVKSFQCESHKVVIGGGIFREDSAYTIEFFDAIKNKWIEYLATTKSRHSQAVIWCDSNNHNIIYIAGDALNTNFLGNIEWTDIRESNPNWYTLENSDNQSNFEEIFDIMGDNNKQNVDWNRRHILI